MKCTLHMSNYNLIDVIVYEEVEKLSSMSWSYLHYKKLVFYILFLSFFVTHFSGRPVKHKLLYWTFTKMRHKNDETLHKAQVSYIIICWVVLCSHLHIGWSLHTELHTITWELKWLYFITVSSSFQLLFVLSCHQFLNLLSKGKLSKLK